MGDPIHKRALENLKRAMSSAAKDTKSRGKKAEESVLGLEEREKDDAAAKAAFSKLSKSSAKKASDAAEKDAPARRRTRDMSDELDKYEGSELERSTWGGSRAHQDYNRRMDDIRKREMDSGVSPWDITPKMASEEFYSDRSERLGARDFRRALSKDERARISRLVDENRLDKKLPRPYVHDREKDLRALGRILSEDSDIETDARVGSSSLRDRVIQDLKNTIRSEAAGKNLRSKDWMNNAGRAGLQQAEYEDTVARESEAFDRDTKYPEPELPPTQTSAPSLPPEWLTEEEVSKGEVATPPVWQVQAARRKK